MKDAPKMGRPPKPIDWKLFEQLCHIQCTHDELASFCHVARDTLYERVAKEYGEDFPTVYKRFSEGGKSSLRRTQFRMAEKNCSMAIWLGKQYLGQRDREEETKQHQKIAFEVNYRNDQHTTNPIEILPSPVPTTDPVCPRQGD